MNDKAVTKFSIELSSLIGGISYSSRALAACGCEDCELDYEEAKDKMHKYVAEIASAYDFKISDLESQIIELKSKLERLETANRMTYVTDDGSDCDRTIFRIDGLRFRKA